MRSAGRLVPALALMAAIFAVSAQSSLPQTDTALDVVGRKAAHMAEFGLLWALWLWALPGARRRAAVAALAITLAYAASDELHQSFVAGRHASAWDVAIAAAGVGVAAALWIVRTHGARHPQRHVETSR